MNLKITGHHLEITPAITDYLSLKLNRVKILQSFIPSFDIHITLTVDNQSEKELRQQASARISLKGKEIFVETHHEDLYAAIDALVDKLDRQVIRYKERFRLPSHASIKHEEFANQFDEGPDMKSVMV